MRGGPQDIRDFDLKQALLNAKDARAKIKKLISYYKRLVTKKAECEAKYCPKIGSADTPNDLNLIGDGFPTINCSATSPQDSIEIGSNADVGSSAKFKEKAKQKAKGLATKALGSLLGVSSGGGGASDKPSTYKDPIKKKQKTRVRDKDLGRDFYAGGAFMDQGLLISSDINKTPNKGTFHEIYIQNPRGWKIVPIGVYMYEIWRDWKLNVSWTRDTYVDGELVKHEEGAWSESWSELIARGEETIYGEVEEAPLWEQFGFNTAVSGASSAGTLFPVSPSMLMAEPHQLIVHISLPKTDPVITYPYVFDINIGDDGSVVLESSETSTVPDCEDYTTVLPGDEPIPVAPALPVENGDSTEAPNESPSETPTLTPGTAGISSDPPAPPVSCPVGWSCQAGKICPPIENCTIASSAPETSTPEDSAEDDTSTVEDLNESDTVGETTQTPDATGYSDEDLAGFDPSDFGLSTDSGYIIEQPDLPTEYGLTFETEEPQIVGIVLQYQAKNWIPEPNKYTAVWAKMYVPSPNNPKLWIPDETVSREMTLSFIARSQEPGIAMNAHAQGKGGKDPDLWLDPSRTVGVNCSVTSAPSGFYDTCTTKFPENQKMFVIGSGDYGGYSRLDVSCEGCVQLKLQANGDKAEGATANWGVAIEESDQEKRAVYVPKDDNRNQIADIWPQDRLYSPDATEDLDNVPVGNGKVGDGLSAYEEYRGFEDDAGKHNRTDIKTKTFMFWPLAPFKTTLFGTASGLEIIDIDWRHMYGRVINFNYGNAHLVDQHGVLVKPSTTMEKGVAGWCDCGIDRPKTAKVIHISAQHGNPGVVAHELGHAVGMHHHGEVKWPKVKQEIRGMTGGLSDMLSGRVHSNTTLCGKQLPDKFWIGTKHDQASGNSSCIMRYTRTNFVYEQEGEDYDCMPYVARSVFDSDAKGTGPNGFDRTSGDASVGDCLSQIWIRSD